MRDAAWQFYVYELLSDDGVIRYIGKGSGQRLAVQRRAFCLNGHEVARFKSEKHAYEFERMRIAEVSPILNVHPGGNGSRAKPTRQVKFAWEREIERIGTRVAAARLVLRFGARLIDPSTLDEIRQVAYGSGN